MVGAEVNRQLLMGIKMEKLWQNHQRNFYDMVQAYGTEEKKKVTHFCPLFRLQDKHAKEAV